MRRKDKIVFALKVLSAAQLLLFLALAAWAGSLEGRVVKVLDGDTIDVLLSDKTTVRVRLAEIDTPEKGQAFGNKAKQAAIDLAAGKSVKVEMQTKDRYGRVVGEVFLSDGRSLNKELVRLGLAWQYRNYSNDRYLAGLEADARSAGRGLWIEPNPVPPWEWRHGGKVASPTKNFASTAVAGDSTTIAGNGNCGQKRYCREMASCDEAIFYLRECGLSALDRDGDGVPCEALCR